MKLIFYADKHQSYAWVQLCFTSRHIKHKISANYDKMKVKVKKKTSTWKAESY